MEKLKCPKCNNTIPLKEVFQFKKSHITICDYCKAQLKPKNIKSWNWGFFLGFLAMVVPAKIYLVYKKNFLIAVAIGIFFAIITIFLIGLYTYLTTELEEV